MSDYFTEWAEPTLILIPFFFLSSCSLASSSSSSTHRKHCTTLLLHYTDKHSEKKERGVCVVQPETETDSFKTYKKRDRDIE